MQNTAIRSFALTFPTCMNNLIVISLGIENQKLKSIQPSPFRGDLDHKTLELLQGLVRDRIISRTELPSILCAFGCEQSVQKYFQKARH